MKTFWKFVALFAYRRWAQGSPVKPTGVPGNRDPDYPCTAYEPRPAKWNDWGRCESDGHYLCNGCAHFAHQTSDSELTELRING